MFLVVNQIVTHKVLAIVEEELLPKLDVLFGVDTDAVVSVYEEDLHLAVGLGRVVSESDVASEPEQNESL